MDDHWESVYRVKPNEKLSWHESAPSTFFLLEKAQSGRDWRDLSVIDVGGGSSPLGSEVASRGGHATVVDISPSALQRSREMHASHNLPIQFVAADVTKPFLVDAPSSFDIWHDRAVFHFLSSEPDIGSYLSNLKRLLKRDGFVAVSTFSLDGPLQCSGLTVRRYNHGDLARVFGDEFELVFHSYATHVTPWGAEQHFVHCLFKRSSSATHGSPSE